MSHESSGCHTLPASRLPRPVVGNPKRTRGQEGQPPGIDQIAVIAALEHPLLGRARAAASVGECYRELPLTLRMSDGLLVEGIADLVFRESDEWIVVDFKTDQELAAELPAYRRQISIYASAVGKAKNTHTSAFLLRV